MVSCATHKYIRSLIRIWFIFIISFYGDGRITPYLGEKEKKNVKIVQKSCVGAIERDSYYLTFSAYS